jgi:hypothetical protein
MMKKTTSTVTPWPTVRRAALCTATGLSDEWADGIKKKLPEGIYWFRMPGSVRVLYNLNLIRDWLVNGSECPAHQKAIESFIASLPSSDAA